MSRVANSGIEAVGTGEEHAEGASPPVTAAASRPAASDLVEEVVASLQADLDAERRATAWLQRELWRSQARTTRLRIELERLDARLIAIGDSTSWLVTTPLRAVGRRFPRFAKAVRRSAKVAFWTVTFQLPRALRERREGLEAARELERRETEESYERWLEAYDTLTEEDLAGMDALARSLEYRPLVSVLLPVYDTPARFLRQAIDSVVAQRYENWELCIADDCSSAPHVRKVLDEYARRDHRIRVAYRQENGGISAASNTALDLASGELVALLDHDDMLRPHSLLLAVRAFNDGEHVAWVYSDEDKIDRSGERSGHYFKPDWSPALLLSQNFLCHLSVVRTQLVRRAGGFRSPFDGSQDWDLALRVTENLPLESVVHVPHVLYHWRTIPGSAATGPQAKPYAIEAARQATQEHLRRIGRPGYVVPVHSHQSVRFLLRERPLVSVLLPSTGDPRLLGPCVAGLLEGTEYDALEIVVVVDENAYSDSEAEVLLSRLDEHEQVRVLTLPAGPFNFARAVNEAATRANGDFLLLLNDDTEVVDEDWLEAMVGHGLQERVGAVGALLLYPDRSIQHAGMLVGAGGIAEHLYNGRSTYIAGYLNRARLAQDLSVVAGACVLVRREAFDELGGLDESFSVAYNDVDFCLRLRDRGWRVLYVPDAVLVHHESASFGSYHRGREDEHAHDAARMRERWGSVLDDDPLHNPNLALDAHDPSRLAFPPRVSYPWRAAATGGGVPAPEPEQSRPVSRSRTG